jgi:hypothetical protein
VISIGSRPAITPVGIRRFIRLDIPAPPRLSTTICWPIDLLILSATMRPRACRRKAPTRPVAQTGRLPATRSNRLLSGWYLPPLVFRAFGAH